MGWAMEAGVDGIALNGEFSECMFGVRSDQEQPTSDI